MLQVGLTFLLKSQPSAEQSLRALATVRMRSDVERLSEKHLLLHCPLFQQSSRKFLDRIAQHMEDRLFMEGEDLCKQGEKGDTMFILIQVGTMYKRLLFFKNPIAYIQLDHGRPLVFQLYFFTVFGCGDVVEV